MNKVIARYVDGTLVKGVTNDFMPMKEIFHISEHAGGGVSAPVAIHTDELKALFFVRDFDGDPAHEELKEFPSDKRLTGRKLRVEFKDGEVLIGTTLGYQPGRRGFFLESIDDESNIERCFVIADATTSVTFI